MKDFTRNDQRFSLCGLNCALCVMRLDGYCPGCGGGPGNQGCTIARCSLSHGSPGGKPLAYCFECGEYPCARYENIDAYDSFITHRRQLADMEKAKNSGLSPCHEALDAKEAILRSLLEGYNDGRRKTFFCLAVNLLSREDAEAAMEQIEKRALPSMTMKEKARIAVSCFEELGDRRGIALRLNKKPKEPSKG